MFTNLNFQFVKLELKCVRGYEDFHVGEQFSEHPASYTRTEFALLEVVFRNITLPNSITLLYWVFGLILLLKSPCHSNLTRVGVDAKESLLQHFSQSKRDHWNPADTKVDLT